MADFPNVLSDSSVQGLERPDYNGYSKELICGAATITADKVGGMLSVGTGDDLAYVAADAATRKVVGVLVGGATNIDGVVATSGQTVIARGGVFLFNNDTGTPVANRHLLGKCYVKDLKTVSMATGSNSVIAGTVIAIQGTMVAVSVGQSYVA